MTFEQLTTSELYALLKLRVDVFVVEQNCPYPELDGHDTHPQTRHLLGFEGSELVAYARVLPPGLNYETPSIGRVVTKASQRRLGTGHTVIVKAMETATQYWPSEAISLAAQAYLKGFYESHGFREVSDEYLEDGIPHIDMVRPADSPD